MAGWTTALLAACINGHEQAAAALLAAGADVGALSMLPVVRCVERDALRAATDGHQCEWEWWLQLGVAFSFLHATFKLLLADNRMLGGATARVTFTLLHASFNYFRLILKCCEVLLLGPARGDHAPPHARCAAAAAARRNGENVSFVFG